MNLRLLYIILPILLGMSKDAYSSPKASNQLVLFPNPINNGSITIEAEKEISNIKILSMVGQVVYSQELESSNSVRLKVDLHSGLYLIQVVFKDQTSDTRRIRVN